MPLQNITLDISLLRERLDYNPKTGDLTWKKYAGNKGFAGYSAWAGKVAGKTRVRPCGYKALAIQLNGKEYAAHRLCWAIMTGEQPPEMIDHISGNGTDNRWENLRDGTHVNQKNSHMKSNNTSGICGVTWSKASRKWQAQIKGNGKQIFLGLFSEIKDAESARLAAENKYGYSSRHGKIKREDKR